MVKEVSKVSFINRIKNAAKALKKEVLNDNEHEKLLEWLGISKDCPKKELNQITYFTCLKIMSETVGKVPIKLYQDTPRGKVKVVDDDLYGLLRVRPNPYMTPSIFWSTVEMNRNHHGNAYVFCRYQGSKIKDLWVMPSEDVTVYVDDKGYFGKQGRIWYLYTDSTTGETWTLNADDVMHFKTSTTFDGIMGKPIRSILRDTIRGGISSQTFMNNLYESGLTAKAVLQYTGDLDKDSKERLVKGIKNFATGKENAGGIIPIPLGMQLTPLNIKLTDSQFFELKKYSALEIAAAFGIKPTFINQYDKSSYANSESEQLGFYVNTMQFVFKHYEEEIGFKGLSTKRIQENTFVKFNEHALLRADSKTQAETLVKYVTNGIYKSNEARDVLDMPYDEHGDQLMANGNFIPLSMIGQQYLKGGEQSE